MTLTELLALATNYMESQSMGNDELLSPIPDFFVHQSKKPTQLNACFYHPIACIILQGSKEAIVGDEKISYRAGMSLIASHSVPAFSRIVEASEEAPYIGLAICLDLGILRSLQREMGEPEILDKEFKPLSTAQSTNELIDAMGRYLALEGKPLEMKVMGPLILKEIHFLLLKSSNGNMLRHLAGQDSHVSKVTQAIEEIRTNFKVTLSVPELAKKVGMSTSSFYEHFKQITKSTPLQYQKELRLIEAQRLIREEQASVSSAAFEVGYESPTQFSREYSRKFGNSPRQELAVLS
ncbi:AraC family transcriptional regulator [Marinomonas sp. SBI22]|uniref:AraC family transcriptional regulator n=1 Tax=unclassified Marinomonas TaxID=196814 RepID=UPI0007AF866C|nr:MULTISPECIES: AraC family transcriptional regulator [unclassified Marinomonas]KZM40469.1 AraC family transcriptional regulator [Marinomonas sp. SBI8L]KZM43560.1 AraC family transcriptional regulator [Marinomonas sp. SBI22]